MKNILKKSVVASVFMTLLCGGTAVQAQDGNGAYVKRNAGPHCIGNSLLGVAKLAVGDCVTMTQTVYMFLPSGRARSVWEATLPANLAPTVRTTHEDFWEETFYGVTYYYKSIAVAMPDGSLKLTLNGDDNP